MADPSDADARTARSRIWTIAGVGAGVLIAFLAVWQAMRDGSWRPPFFFDEMWRVDFIRSSHPIDRMLTHDVPIPLGWVLLMRAVTAPIPYHPFVFRVFNVAWFLGGVATLVHLFARILQREPRWPKRETPRRSVPPPVLVAAAGVAFMSFSPLVTHSTQWFNNYTFEVFYVAVMVLAAEELDRAQRWAFPLLCTTVALAPAFVLGGLFAVPAVVVGAAWWLWRDPEGRARRARRGAALVASCAIAAVTGLVEWVKIYRPLTNKPVTRTYWIDSHASLGGSDGFGTLLRTTARQLVDGMMGDRLAGMGGPVRLVSALVVAGSVIVGLVVVGRRWPLLVGLLGSAWLLTVIASAAVQWPMTIERVNLCWQILLFTVGGIGLAWTLVSVVWSAPPVARWIVVPLLAAVLVALWFPPYAVGLNAFGRDLTVDLQRIGASPAARNIVFQYHDYGHFFADNELINTTREGKRFDIVPQYEGDRSLFEPLDSKLDGLAPQPGDLVWCVMPWELATDTELACRFANAARLEPVIDERGKGALVKAFRVR